ncbi:MAG: hypothetical protein MJZ81_11935 [Bacteroidales bacterium]|nr:hypothetical protein [Bacteroidales bacterium]
MSRNAYEMLVKCGYSTEDASRISGWHPSPTDVAAEKRAERLRIAAENERRYGGLRSELEDVSRFRGADTSISFRYDTIERCKPDVGDCTTRKGVYRRLKYGKGNMTERSWIRAGFERNLREAQ